MDFREDLAKLTTEQLGIVRVAIKEELSERLRAEARWRAENEIKALEERIATLRASGAPARGRPHRRTRPEAEAAATV